MKKGKVIRQVFLNFDSIFAAFLNGVVIFRRYKFDSSPTPRAVLNSLMIGFLPRRRFASSLTCFGALVSML